jgi:hypothetical protein
MSRTVSATTQPFPEWSFVLSFFKSLNLDHLERCLYSLSRQTIACPPKEFILFDNNSGFTPEEIISVLQKHFKVEEWVVYFARHNGGRTLSWSNNSAIRLARCETFMLVRADFIYDFRFFEKMLLAYNNEPMSYVTSWMYGLPENDYEQFAWRLNPQNLLANSGFRPERVSQIDGPTFCTSKKAMDAAGWYDEALVGWGFDQQDLQQHMIRNGVQMKVYEEYLYFHQGHEVEPGQRDIERAREVWKKSPRRRPEILAEEARIKAEAVESAKRLKEQLSAQVDIVANEMLQRKWYRRYWRWLRNWARPLVIRERARKNPSDDRT